MAKVIEFDPLKKTAISFNPKVSLASNPTPQQEVAQKFVDILEHVEDFAVLVRTKDRKALLFTCIDDSLNVWTFVDAFKANATNVVVDQLFANDAVDHTPTLA